MSDIPMDINRELMVDGNAVSGILHEIFAAEMTIVPAECASCGNVAEIGAMLAFTRGPGIVLRCPACEEVMLRIVETDSAFYLDARGVTVLRLEKNAR